MRYVRDATGRFHQRPHYDPDELDAICENLITAFVVELHGDLILPIPTDDLTKLIERDVDDLDLYADLSDEGPDVEGVTYFSPGQKPSVRIAARLSAGDPSEHRLRTTLTHEYGHVKLHTALFDSKLPAPALFSDEATSSRQRCQRNHIFGAALGDWMEWQAGYTCGALLIPVGPFRTLVRDFVENYNLYGLLHAQTQAAGELTHRVATQFAVSREAARIRLLQKNYLTENPVGPSLFG